MKQKLFTLLLAFIAAISFAGATDLASGTFSNGGTWKITGVVGNATLEIYASNIPSYTAVEIEKDHHTYAPWSAYKNTISKIDLHGVTKIGDYAFAYLSKVRTVRFLDKSNADVVIGRGAFRGCYKLVYIDLTYAKEIGESAFSECPSLESIFLPNIQTIRRYAFDYCPGMYHGGFNGQPSIWLTGSTSPTIEQPVGTWGAVYDPVEEKQVGKTVSTSERFIIVATNATVKSNVRSSLSTLSIRESREYRIDVRLGGILPHASNISDLHCYWYINKDQYTQRECILFISEYGDLDFASETATPWYSVRSSIESISLQVADPHTRKVGKNAFKGLTNLTKVDGAMRISEFGENAFSGCTKLKTIDLNGAQKIGTRAFASTILTDKVNLTAA